MPRKKRYDVRVEVLLPKELADFLDSMVEKGVADSVSGAVRRCIALVKTYLPEIRIEIKGEEGGEES